MTYLMHYGVLGMKWGVRRYHNKDGSLTAAGKKRYNNPLPSRTTRGAFSKGDIRRTTDAAKLGRHVYKQYSKIAKSKKAPATKNLDSLLKNMESYSALTKNLSDRDIQYGKNRAARQRNIKVTALSAGLGILAYNTLGVGAFGSKSMGYARRENRAYRNEIVGKYGRLKKSTAKAFKDLDE